MQNTDRVNTDGVCKCQDVMVESDQLAGLHACASGPVMTGNMGKPV